MSVSNKTLEQLIGERIGQRRFDLNLTQQQLADICGVKRETINQWENGARQIKAGDLLKLSKALNCTVDFLVTAEEGTEHNIHYIVEQTGLSEAAINELLDTPFPDESNSQEDYLAMNRQNQTMGYRAVINLLLTNEEGREALKMLDFYYHSVYNLSAKEEESPFLLKRNLSDNRGLPFEIEMDISSETVMREKLLDFVAGFLKQIRRKQEQGIDTETTKAILKKLEESVYGKQNQ